MADRRLTVRLRQDAPFPLDVEFECGAGEVLAIFGASGSGKTTLLRSIAGLHTPAQARVHMGSEAWTDTDAGLSLPPHRRSVGYVFQEYALFPHLSAAHNVTVALGHLPRARRRARAQELLAQVHLANQADRSVTRLSGGERQRVALARALAREPSVLLLDEPFAAVDRAVRRRLQDEVDDLRRALGMPTVLVTHDLGDVVRLATHLLVLDRGRAVACGTVADVTSRAEAGPLRDAIGLGSVVNAVVTQVIAERGLVALALGSQTLLASVAPGPVGSRVRLRIPAREVILATRPPDGLSLHNVLPAVVRAVHHTADTPHAVVQLAVGDALLLSEVTADAVVRLGIAPGQALFALVKSVSLDAAATPPAEAAER